MANATSRVSNVPSPLRPLWNPDTCPVDLLPWLAWALSVDVWVPTWPEATKRAVVRNAVSTSRRKGTRQAVSDALSAIGAGVEMKEWWQKSPAGTPHTFTISIVAQDTSVEAQAIMVQEINRTKPLRSQYDIVFGTAGTAPFNIVSIGRVGVFTRLDGQATY